MTDDNKEGGAGKIKTAVNELRANATTKAAEIVNACWNFGMHRIEDVAKARVMGESKGEIIRKFDNAAADAVLAGRDPAEIRQMRDSFIAEQTLYYDNIKAIGDRAIPHIKEGAKAENVNTDTIMHLREKSKITSEEEMREMLARILAGEINAPGSFSKKTIDVVSSLDRGDLESFSRLCSFVVNWSSPAVVSPHIQISSVKLGRSPLVFDEKEMVYGIMGITFTSLQNMSSLGLLTYTLTGLRTFPVEIPLRWVGSGNGFAFIAELQKNQAMPKGRVMFTRSGDELSRVCESEVVPGFSSYIMEEYKKGGINCRMLKPEDAI